MIKESIQFAEQDNKLISGKCGVKCQLPRKATTIGNVVSAIGGIAKGKIIEIDRK